MRFDLICSSILCRSQEEWVEQKAELHENLEYQFRENLMEMGKGHKEAADQVLTSFLISLTNESMMILARL